MKAKNTKGYPPEEAANKGKIPEMSAFINQCEKLPRLCPLARTRFGKTSLRKTRLRRLAKKEKMRWNLLAARPGNFGAVPKGILSPLRPDMQRYPQSQSRAVSCG